MILDISVAVFIDMRVVEKHFVLLNACERITDLSLAGAQRLHLRALQHDPGLEHFEHMIIAARFWIADDVGHCDLRCTIYDLRGQDRSRAREGDDDADGRRQA